MSGKRYYWLKVKEDFFNQKELKKLRQIAGGDTYTIIYLKMLLIAIKNDGVLEYSGLEPSFAEELALDLDEGPDDVALAIYFLSKYGLIQEMDESGYFLPYAVQNLGTETAGSRRVREFRSRQKALQDDAQCNAQALQDDAQCNAQALQDDAQCNAKRYTDVTPLLQCNAKMPKSTEKALHCNNLVTERRDRDRDREDIELELDARARAHAHEVAPTNVSHETIQDDLARVMTYYMDKINPTPSQSTVTMLKTYTRSLSADVVIHAMGVALDERKTSISYIRAILQRYSTEGLKTMDAVLRSEEEYQNRKGGKDNGDGINGGRVPGDTGPSRKPKYHYINDLDED